MERRGWLKRVESWTVGWSWPAQVEARDSRELSRRTGARILPWPPTCGEKSPVMCLKPWTGPKAGALLGRAQFRLQGTISRSRRRTGWFQSRDPSFRL